MDCHFPILGKTAICACTLPAGLDNYFNRSIIQAESVKSILADSIGRKWRNKMTKEVNREQQEKLPTKKGTLQVFFANAVRRGKEGEILTHMGSDKPKRGHYGLVHDDSYDCESPDRKGTLQVFFANAVRRGKEGEILTHMGSDKPKRGHYGLVHDDSYDCESPVECRDPGHVVYLSATVVLKALGLRRGTPISFGARTNDDGKERAVFVRFN